MGTLRFSSPLRGFCLALLTTLAAFALVQFKTFDRRTTLLLIASLALAQGMAHFRYFLNLRLNRKSRDPLVALAFAVLVLLAMVAGSMWIMGDLKMRMMP